MQAQNFPPSTHISRTKEYDHKGDGSEAYKLSPIDLSTLAELEDYLRGEVLSVIESQVVGKAPLIQEVIVQKALELGDKRRIGTNEFNRAVQSFNGMVHLLYLSLRPNHPELSVADARRILSEANESKRIGHLTSTLFAVSGFETGKESGLAPLTTKAPKAAKR